jgi:hypothetical protein
MSASKVRCHYGSYKPSEIQGFLLGFPHKTRSLGDLSNQQAGISPGKIGDRLNGISGISQLKWRAAN